MCLMTSFRCLTYLKNEHKNGSRKDKQTKKARVRERESEKQKNNSQWYPWTSREELVSVVQILIEFH